jgi:hypothetical protein
MEADPLAELRHRWSDERSTLSFGNLGRALVRAGTAGEWESVLEDFQADLDLASLGAERIGIFTKERVSLAAWRLPPDLGAFVLLVSSWDWLDEKRTRLVEISVLRKGSRLQMMYHVTDDDAGGPAACWVLVQAHEGARCRLVASVPCDDWHGNAGGYAANADSKGMAPVLSTAAAACGASFNQQSLW